MVLLRDRKPEVKSIKEIDHNTSSEQLVEAYIEHLSLLLDKHREPPNKKVLSDLIRAYEQSRRFFKPPKNPDGIDNKKRSSVVLSFRHSRG